ncbi:hypothetical protein GGTG_04182 [Gaeumannomyces tritici R3-111a-1]|uniref:Uncharacterized protein n=1 Tax=Gaeumannomyces tritici (strain R3-111a-1) TaxID=644352 RepID=J3NSD6_GAET3|nr:hypothetical protein GGTG_04182 [Gaeumannomyces tritici R3-111a-1]EJT79093.1 hypothetical protein GGTG_04182 [Gaeumannomyces tritici R3-111a-1]
MGRAASSQPPTFEWEGVRWARIVGVKFEQSASYVVQTWQESPTIDPGRPEGRGLGLPRSRAGVGSSCSGSGTAQGVEHKRAAALS